MTDFDFAIEEIRRFIIILEEYRKALITNAVTGQLDIRD